MSDDKRKSVMSVVIYGAVLFAVAALLVTMSLIINVRNTKRLENEMDEAQQGAARAQTTLVSVQEENETLRGMLDDANDRIAELKEKNAGLSSEAELNEKRIASLDAIAAAGMDILNSRYSLARDQLALVDTSVLTEDEMAAYERMYKRVN